MYIGRRKEKGAPKGFLFLAAGKEMDDMKTIIFIELLIVLIKENRS